MNTDGWINNIDQQLERFQATTPDSRSGVEGISPGVTAAYSNRGQQREGRGGEGGEGDVSRPTQGQESRVAVLGLRPGTEAESGHSHPYPSLRCCWPASRRTKGALFWAARRDQQIQGGGKERGQRDARKTEGGGRVSQRD